MKAAIYSRYGPPDVVQISDVEKPVAGDDEVLIKVCAASINPADWHFMRGMPYPVRIMGGLRKPKIRLGLDVADLLVWKKYLKRVLHPERAAAGRYECLLRMSIHLSICP